MALPPIVDLLTAWSKMGEMGKGRWPREEATRPLNVADVAEFSADPTACARSLAFLFARADISRMEVPQRRILQAGLLSNPNWTLDALSEALAFHYKRAGHKFLEEPLDRAIALNATIPLFSLHDSLWLLKIDHRARLLLFNSPYFVDQHDGPIGLALGDSEANTLDAFERHILRLKLWECAPHVAERNGWPDPLDSVSTL